ncbi:MAG: hypothetical protein WEC17_01750 [Candidatus Saccharimonadales bacterium]
MDSISIRFKRHSSALFFIAVSFALIATALFPALMFRNASALQITSRSLTIDSSVAGASSRNYTFTFTVASTTDVEGLKFQACTTAVGTCSGTAGTDIPNFSSRTFGSQSGWQGATNFAVDTTGANDCTPSSSVICANRTDATAQTVTSRSINFNGIANQSSLGTFFIRMTTYSTNNYTGGSIVDTGTVASSVTQTLTINAAVAEVLNFCVGASTVNDATTSVAGDCTGVSGTNVNIGTLDTSFTNISPVSTNGGDNENGAAMLRTNAINGATVSYRAIQQSGTNHLGTLRIGGATCDADDTVITDQCIRAQGTTQGTFTAGTERFGMTIAAINCGSTTSYACTFTSGTYNLVRDANYDGDGGNTYPTDSGTVSGTTDAGYAWDDTGTFTQIASSTGSTTKVIDDETMVLKFAATPSITTPFGAYTAQADFIAVATY